MIYRLIRPSDTPEVIALSRAAHQESIYRHLEFSEENLLSTISACCSSPTTHHATVVIKDKMIVGGIIGAITPYWFTSDKIAFDLVIYIDPVYRGGITAVRLLTRFEKWAILNGASRIMLGISSGINPKTTGKLYTKLGFREIGSLHCKDY